MTNTNTGSYVAYVGLIIAAFAKFGWIADPATVTTVVAGIVALVGIIYQHYTTKKVVTAARAGRPV